MANSGFSLPAHDDNLAATPAVYGGLFLVSFCTLLFEIVLTRVFSAAMWYHFAFMVLSLVMFGMTIGSALVYRFQSIFRQERTLRHLSLFAGLFAILMPVSLLAFFRLPLRPNSIIPSALELFSGDSSRFSVLLTYIIFTLPFICSGICTCLALTRFKFQTNKLYATDLIGASFACLLVVALLFTVDAPSVVLINACLASLGAFLFALVAQSRALKHSAAIASLFFLFGAFGNIYSFSHGMPFFGLKQSHLEGQTIYQKWSPTCYLTVEERPNKIWGWGLDPSLGINRVCDHYWVAIDHHAGTPLYKFEGDLKKLDFLKFDVSNIVHSIRPTGDVFVIGMGGGKDILGALLFDHRHVVGTEFNTSILDLLHSTFNTYTGKLDQWPGVEIVDQEARSYLASSARKFDIIQGTLAYTGSAVQYGGLALTENSVYTVEAWRNFISHLSDNGMMSITLNYSSKKPFLVYRMCSIACAALGLEHARNHLVLIGRQEPFPNQPFSYSTLLVSKKPFSENELDVLEQTAHNIHSDVILSPRTCIDPGLEAIVDEHRRTEFLAQFPLTIDAPTDDRPFFFSGSKPSDYFNLQKWSQILRSENTARDPVLVLLSLLVTIGVLTVICILLPLTAPLTKTDIKNSLPLVTLFSSIGIGFMMVEISQMQRLTIFLGHPIFGLTVVLFTLLVSSGMGSLSIASSGSKPDKKALLSLSALPLALILVCVLAPFMTAALASASLPNRIICSVLLLAIPGFFMGIPLPVGISIANARGSTNLSAWLWGINGATSVLGSILATTVSLCSGIQTTFIIGIFCYLICLLSYFCLMRSSPGAGGDIIASLPKASRQRIELLLLTLLGILIPFIPWLNRMVAPIDLFTTGAHQLSHATVSILRGLPLQLLSADDKLPFSESVLQDGGVQFLGTQAGYLLLASLVCLIVASNKWPKFSKMMVLAVGGLLSATIAIFTFSAIFRVGATTALVGMICVLVATVYYAYASFQFDNLAFRVLLFFIGLQTAWISADSLRCLTTANVASRIVAAAHESVGQRLWIGHRTITHWGDLACAVAITHVLQDAGVSTMDALSVSALTDQLYRQGWKRFPFDDRRPGDVIIALAPKREHTGIVDFDINATFSNHSSSRRWLQDSASYWVTYPFTVLYVLRPPITNSSSISPDP